jgi:cytochrome P450
MTSAAFDLDLSRLRRLEDPYPVYRRMRDECPVYRDEHTGSYALTRFDDVVAILGDRERFSNEPLDIAEGRMGRLSPLKEADPPRHTFVRRLVMPLFTPAAMRAREASFLALAVELLDEAERHEIVEVTEMLAIPLPGRVMLDILGLPASEHPRFRQLTDERLQVLAVHEGRVKHVEGGGPPRTIDEVRADLWTMVEPLALARRVKPRNDAITLLADAQDEYGRDELSEADFVDLMLTLLAGGFETTQHLIELLGDYLADHPELWAQMRADRSLVPKVIEEMLRWDAPLQEQPRRATTDAVVRNVPIPKNSRVYAVYGSANRDERVFDDPDEFRPDRDVRRHTSFGLGIHYCPGAPVSRAEVRILLDEMLDRYDRIERAAPSERAPEPDMRGWSRVPVRLERD